MASPQAGIFREGTRHHHFMEYSLAPGAGADAALDALIAARDAATLSPAAQTSDEGPSTVIAFGAALWAQLAPQNLPHGLRAFEVLGGGDGPTAPATQRDLLIWVHGPRIDDALDCAMALHRSLGEGAWLELDETGFTYHDSRDLTGFIDGTANPKGEAAQTAALVPQGQPGEGGAFVLSQRWVHDLESFLALPVAEQERVIGRTKPDSIELEGDAMPPDSHVARTDAKVDGVAMKIYRRSTPFGSVSEHGLYFLAFACDATRFDVLLRRMFGGWDDGPHDRLTAYSTPVTGAYWFAPSEDALRALSGPR